MKQRTVIEDFNLICGRWLRVLLGGILVWCTGMDSFFGRGSGKMYYCTRGLEYLYCTFQSQNVDGVCD